VIVRRAELEDVDAMARVIAVVAEEGLLGSQSPVDVAARAEKFREAVRSDGHDAVWVLEDEGQVVGNAGVSELDPGVLYLGMALLPHARGQGGGRALLQAVAQYAERCGAHKIDLEVWVDNSRAITLYISAGFEIEGTRRNHYRRRDGQLRSALLMSQYLTSNFSQARADS
jgi:RimJ/RimL family protein N-acetyltransferase